MKQTVTYKAKIHSKYSKCFDDTVRIYREAVSFLIDVVLSDWGNLFPQSSVLRTNRIESLIHSTSKRPHVQYPDFDKLFYKFPSYLRRSAISLAIGKVATYKALLKQWNENNESNRGKAPGKPVAGYSFPAMYHDGQFLKTGTYTARIKVWIRNTWDWIDVSFRKSDIDYIQNHCAAMHECSPVLLRKGRQWFLAFSFEEECTLNETELSEQTVIAVDLGINSACTCCAMKSDGTVIGREFLSLPREEDSLKHRLNKVKKAQQHGAKKTPAKWASVNAVNRHIAEQTAAFITEVAMKYNATHIVFEHLDIRTRAKGKSKRQRLALWRYAEIQGMVTVRAHRNGIRVSTVNAYATSSLAYDGTGKVTRSKSNYSICTFSTGKQYNCDLNAAYNIGARYFIREITNNIKSLPETVRLSIQAKVPECFKRSTCTLSTLLNLNAVINSSSVAC